MTMERTIHDDGSVSITFSKAEADALLMEIACTDMVRSDYFRELYPRTRTQPLQRLYWTISGDLGFIETGIRGATDYPLPVPAPTDGLARWDDEPKPATCGHIAGFIALPHAFTPDTQVPDSDGYGIRDVRQAGDGRRAFPAVRVPIRDGSRVRHRADVRGLS
jgi:hypothetical protein